MQVWGVPEMLRLMFNNKSSSSGVSSFQALAVSLAGRVGTGNIAGVATAIAFGGPGAVFWMWAMAFFGASTSYIECTLAQRSEEHTSELQSLMRISYAVFCLKKKTKITKKPTDSTKNK